VLIFRRIQLYTCSI